MESSFRWENVKQQDFIIKVNFDLRNSLRYSVKAFAL
jgi:hypothetical protein